MPPAMMSKLMKAPGYASAGARRAQHGLRSGMNAAQHGCGSQFCTLKNLLPSPCACPALSVAIDEIVWSPLLSVVVSM